MRSMCRFFTSFRMTLFFLILRHFVSAPLQKEPLLLPPFLKGDKGDFRIVILSSFRNSLHHSPSPAFCTLSPKWRGKIHVILNLFQDLSNVGWGFYPNLFFISFLQVKRVVVIFSFTLF